MKIKFKMAYYCTGNIWNTGGGATVIRNILENTTIDRDSQLLFISSWVQIPDSISSKFIVIRLKTPKKRILQEIYDQLIAPTVLLKYSIDRVICLNSIVPLLYPKRIDVFYQMRMYYFEEYDSLSKKVKNLLGIFSIIKSHTVFVASKDHKSDLVKNIKFFNKNKNKIKVNYLGYRAVKINKDVNKNSNDEFLLFVSVIRPYKNLDRLVKAYKISFDVIGTNLPKLYIVGNIPDYKGIDEYMRNIYEFIKINKLCDFIIFKGSQKHENVIELMRESTALVFPTLFEGFGLPLLEAMANSVPILTSNRNSLPEVGANTVTYFDPESIEDMGNKIINLIKYGYEDDLLKKAYLRSQLFNWKKTSIALENDIEHIINSY